METTNLVLEFHKASGHPVGTKIKLLSKERMLQRIKFIQSELNELKDAVEEDNLVEIVDALEDIRYFVDGTHVEMGTNGIVDSIFHEIHYSNMSKFCSTEEEVEKSILNLSLLEPEEIFIYKEIAPLIYVIYDSNNKVRKGITYRKPDLKPIIYANKDFEIDG